MPTPTYIDETGAEGAGRDAGEPGRADVARIEGDEAEFVVMSLWESREAIVAFAGEDIEVAHYYPEDDRYLLVKDPKCHALRRGRVGLATSRRPSDAARPSATRGPSRGGSRRSPATRWSASVPTKPAIATTMPAVTQPVSASNAPIGIRMISASFFPSMLAVFHLVARLERPGCPHGLRSHPQNLIRVMPAKGVEVPIPRCLTIATSDSGGGAGIQADLKAFASLGCHGMSAVVALTAQNTTEVRSIHEAPPEFIRAQLATIWDDIGVDAAKTGMLFSAEIVETVAAFLETHPVPLVVDPVMVAASGARLLRDDAVSVLVERLLPLATVVTPNLHEACVLAGVPYSDDREPGGARRADPSRSALRR